MKRVINNYQYNSKDELKDKFDIFILGKDLKFKYGVLKEEKDKTKEDFIKFEETDEVYINKNSNLCKKLKFEISDYQDSINNFKNPFQQVSNNGIALYSCINFRYITELTKGITFGYLYLNSKKLIPLVFHPFSPKTNYLFKFENLNIPEKQTKEIYFNIGLIVKKLSKYTDNFTKIKHEKEILEKCKQHLPEDLVLILEHFE